jgi:hypothetical protein
MDKLTHEELERFLKRDRIGGLIQLALLAFATCCAVLLIVTG